jgi:dienelactone hydrolase
MWAKESLMHVSFPRQPGSVLLAWALALSAVFPISLVSAQIARLEVHPIQTQTPTEQEFLNGKRDAKPAIISGELRIPRAGTDRLPAVILLHGSGGPSGIQDNWAREFATLGIATFIVDSFSGRGITSTSDDQDQLSRLAHIGDAYRALEVLGKHPRIDPARIVVMGFSRGGGAAHYSALKRFAAMHGPAGGLTFAGYIGLYPTCNRDFIDGLEVVDKPIRIFHGAADDYVPAAECRTYVERLRKAGKDITLTEYPGAYHIFDNPALKNPTKLPQAQTTRGCPRLEEEPGGRMVNSRTKRQFTYASDPCVERGVTVAYDAQAHTEVVKAIKEFLVVVLKPT